MAERSTITQVVQFGMENTSTPGTAVAATKRMQTLDVTTGIKASVDAFRPSGFKFSTLLSTQREWTELDMKGAPTFSELIYPLASILKSVTPTTILDTAIDTTGRLWTFSPSTTTPDTVQTFTIEQGSSVRAHRMPGCIFTDFMFKFTREKAEMSGKILAGKVEDGFTLSGGTTSNPLIPITANQISVYLDTTSAGLGTTKLGRLFSGELGMASRFGPVWVVDAALPSYATTVETVPKLSFKTTVEADAAGMALLTDMRANTTKFLRILATGPNIYTGGVVVNYSLQIDMAVSVKQPEAFKDEQGVYAIGFEMEGIHDATWGKAIEVKLTNKQTAL